MRLVFRAVVASGLALTALVGTSAPAYAVPSALDTDISIQISERCRVTMTPISTVTFLPSPTSSIAHESGRAEVKAEGDGCPATQNLRFLVTVTDVPVGGGGQSTAQTSGLGRASQSVQYTKMPVATERVTYRLAGLVSIRFEMLGFDLCVEDQWAVVAPSEAQPLGTAPCAS